MTKWLKMPLDKLCNKQCYKARKWFPKKLEMQAHFEKPCN